MKEVIIRNKIKCKNCGDVIESKFRHDYKECSCGNCAVDGGHSYLRRCFVSRDGFEELSEVIEITDEMAQAESEAKTKAMAKSLSMQDDFCAHLFKKGRKK